MAKQQQPFGGAPRIGTNTAPGEPADFPVPSGVAGHGGAPTFAGQINRGEKAINPSPENTATPAPYGGGEPMVKQPNAKPVKGGGANVGAGATSGSTQPVP